MPAFLRFQNDNPRRCVGLILLSGLYLAITPVMASDSERAALARLAHEIERLEPLIATAEQAANPAARINFRYDWLRQDLDRIAEGVREHAAADRNEPRAVLPLKGDYRR